MTLQSVPESVNLNSGMKFLHAQDAIAMSRGPTQTTNKRLNLTPNLEISNL